MLTIVGFYTDDFLYSEHARLLRDSGKKNGLNIELQCYKKDEWQKIIAMKSSFILEKRKKVKGKILYIDVDAVILENIQPFFESIKLGIACIWRIASELAEDMGITVSEQPNIQADMAKASGVITFPSTVALEAMKLGIPTAIVEYDVNPLYVESAWQIRSKAHIYGVIHELLYPPYEKRAYQDFCLDEELESGDATSKLVRLIQDIVAGNIEPAEKNSCAVYGALDYRLVHSQLTTFATSNMATLQYELDANVKYRTELRQKILILYQKVIHLSQNIMTNFWIKLLLKFPFGSKGVRRMLRDINDIQSNIHKIVHSTDHKE